MDIKESCWKDITGEFKDSVAQLSLGELMKNEQFTLLEAMSAIELMDPKMDTAMLFNKSGRDIPTFEQSIRSGKVRVNNLEPEELIGIIDDTYACLATWLEGNLIAQTVMTNLYLHDTKRVEDRCLRVFCQAILKIVDFIDKLVLTVYCVEEEDFTSDARRFNLATELNEQKVLTQLEDLCQHYEKLLLGQTNNLNKKTQSGTVPDESQPEISITMDKAKLTAILTRLRFTTNLYAFFLTMSKNILKEHNIDGPNSVSLIQKTIKLVQSSAIQCDQSLERCFKLLGSWSASIEMGVRPIARQDSTNDRDSPTIMGFDPLVNHKILPPVQYPRCQSIKSRPETIQYFTELITKLRECILVSQNFYQKSFNRSLESIEQFSKYFQPKSCVITRSFMLILYLPIRLDIMLKDELTLSLTEYCESIMPIIKKDPIKATTLSEFLNESIVIFSQVITLYGHNPSRQHEKIATLINSFKNLQYSAYLVNDVLKNNFVYSWTTYYFAKLCIKYVLAGLELELFSPHEYPYVFWYLYDILYRNEKSELEYAKHLLFESQLSLDQEAQNSANNSTKSAASGKKKNKKKTLINTTFHDTNLLLNDALRFLTGGMFLLTYGLKLQGKIRIPSMEFTTEEICFDHRFGSITGSTVYPAYKFTLGRLDKLESIYTEAFDCFSEAKQLFEKHGSGQEGCITVCKANMVVARLLSSKSNSFADRAVEFCFDRHPSFPTVKL